MMSYLRRDAARIRALVDAKVEPGPDVDELFVFYALLLRVKGRSVGAEDVHDAWSAWREVTGGGTDRNIVPFAELSPDVQVRDQPFVRAIRAAAAQDGAGG